MKWITLCLCIFAFGSCRDSYSDAARTTLSDQIRDLRVEKRDLDREITDQFLVVRTNQAEEIFDTKPEAAFRHAPPKFELRSPCEAFDRKCSDGIWIVDLPNQGTEVIERYWADAIKFHYANRVLYAGMTPDEQKRLSEIHEDNMNRMYDQLATVEIQAPYRVRKLSHFEIGQLTEQLNRFAQDVVDSIDAASRHRSA